MAALRNLGLRKVNKLGCFVHLGELKAGEDPILVMSAKPKPDPDVNYNAVISGAAARANVPDSA